MIPSVINPVVQWRLVLFAGLAALFAGCSALAPASHSVSSGSGDYPAVTAAGAASGDRIRVGDPISIEFSGVAEAPQRINERLKDGGNISLQYISEPLKVEGLTRGDLEKIIHDLYVPKIYRRLTVKVGVEGRFFTVSGEVRKPDRHPYLGDMTILKAVAVAGDLTDFGSPRRVELIRGNAKPVVVDLILARRDPTKDIPILPDDHIRVPRRGIFR